VWDQVQRPVLAALVVEAVKMQPTLVVLEQQIKDTLVVIVVYLEQEEQEVAVPVLWVAMQPPLMKYRVPVGTDYPLLSPLAQS
jgi:hypothetical protein